MFLLALMSIRCIRAETKICLKTFHQTYSLICDLRLRFANVVTSVLFFLWQTYLLHLSTPSVSLINIFEIFFNLTFQNSHSQSALARCIVSLICGVSQGMNGRKLVNVSHINVPLSFLPHPVSPSFPPFLSLKKY